MDSNSQLLKIPQAAERLQLSRSKVYELIALGQLQTVKIGSAVRIPTESIEGFIRRLTEQTDQLK